MASITLYLDRRRTASGSPSPIKIAIYSASRVVYIPTGVSVPETSWDKTRLRVSPRAPQGAVQNAVLKKRLSDVEDAVNSLSISGEIGPHSPAQIIKEKVLRLLTGVPEMPADLLCERFRLYISRLAGRTAELYECTLKKILAFGKGGEGTRMSDINKSWVESFDRFLAQTAPSRNARNIHLRNLRAVFNDALDDEVITNYPFRKFTIRNEKTRKRALSPRQLHILANAPLAGALSKHRDIFLLSFLLIGTNIGDLCLLRDTADGRVEFSRRKTKRLYSIKVEPEAAQLIERHRGKNWLIDVMDTNKDYRSFYKHFAAALKSLPSLLPEGSGITELTSYWARHSWATIAASLDIPKETIARALGHGCDTVTDVYIDFDMRKVDQANRRVIDWVYYGKDWRNPEKPK